MNFGDSELDTTLTKYSRIPNRFRIIGLFDCDEGNGKNILEKVVSGIMGTMYME